MSKIIESYLIDLFYGRHVWTVTIIRNEKHRRMARLERGKITTFFFTPTFELQGSQKKNRKRKDMRKLLKRLQLKISPYMEKEIVSQVQEAQSPIQDKSKEKHAKTHTHQTDKTQRKNIKSSKGEATSNIQGKPHMLNS